MILHYWVVSGAPNADDGSDPENPVRVALQDRNETQGLRLMGNAFAEVKVVDWLRYRFTAGIDMLNSEYAMILPVYSDGYNGRTQSILEITASVTFQLSSVTSLLLTRRFDKHYINAVVVAEQQGVLARAIITRTHDDNNDLNEINGGISPTLNTRRYETLLYSYAGRVNYGYAQKYLFSAEAYNRKVDNLLLQVPISISFAYTANPTYNIGEMKKQSSIRNRYGKLGFPTLEGQDGMAYPEVQA
jgi:hypothetical protein